MVRRDTRADPEGNDEGIDRARSRRHKHHPGAPYETGDALTPLAPSFWVRKPCSRDHEGCDSGGYYWDFNGLRRSVPTVNSDTLNPIKAVRPELADVNEGKCANETNG
jgi:hypothetical protein